MVVLPDPVEPMLAVLHVRPPSGAGLAFEMKWDGWRALAGVAGGQMRFTSRNGNDLTAAFPELAELPDAVGGRAVLLDGEIVALDETGKPAFELLQSRTGFHRPHKTDTGTVTPRIIYYVFDLLHLDGESVMHLPYTRRREQLTELAMNSPHVIVPPWWVDVDGPTMLNVARRHRLEGIVAKRLDSPYRPGRSPDWMKTPLRKRAEVIIGGWTLGEGRRAGRFGALLLGAYNADGELVYIGDVGAGWSDGMLDQLTERLKPLSRRDSPFTSEVSRDRARHAHWVEPDIVGEVEYRTVTRDGRIRHSAWKGVRDDKDPSEVTLDALRELP